MRVLHLIRKEFLELRREPRLFGIVIMAPIIQLTMLGYAATTDVRDVPVVVADGDRSSLSRELVSRFDASANFTVGSSRNFSVGGSSTNFNLGPGRVQTEFAAAISPALRPLRWPICAPAWVGTIVS